MFHLSSEWLLQFISSELNKQQLVPRESKCVETLEAVSNSVGWEEAELQITEIQLDSTKVLRSEHAETSKNTILSGLLHDMGSVLRLHKSPLSSNAQNKLERRISDFL